MKGWHRESMRHSLAARGIRSRGLIYPSGRPDPSSIHFMATACTTIDHLAEILKSGIKDSETEGLKGGITTNEDLVIDSAFENFGQIYIVLDPKVMLKKNDFIKVRYTKKFLREHPDIMDRISTHRTKHRTENEIETLANFYAMEEELVSREPIKIPINAIKIIEIAYSGEDSLFPTHYKLRSEKALHDYNKMTEEKRSYREGKAIAKEIERKIPRGYWDLIWLNNQTTGEKQKLTWLI